MSTVPDIRYAMSAMPRMSAVSRSNSANRDGDGENDGKECFHRTKVSLPLARVRVRDGLRNRGSFIAPVIPAGSATHLAANLTSRETRVHVRIRQIPTNGF
jgi:hypothetical protein